MGAPEITLLVGCIVVGIIATIAYRVLSVTPVNFQIARRCFLAMTFVIGGLAVMWHISTNESLLVRVLVTGLIGAVVVAGLSEGLRWIGRRESASVVSAAQMKIAALEVKLDDRERRQKIRVALGYLLDYGRQLLEKCEDESGPPPNDEAQKWADDAEQFMHDSMDDSFVARFRDGSGLPTTETSITSPSHRNLWSGIRIRTSRLQEFLHELGYQ